MFDPGGWFMRINAITRQTPSLNGTAAAWTTYGVLVFGALLVGAWWIARSRSDKVMAAALLAPVSVVIAYAINQPIAHAIDEARPFIAHPDALVLVGRSMDPSFPSDHAVVAGAACMALFFVSRRIFQLTALLAILFAISRVYVGVHYPADVVAGLALGGIVAVIVWLLTRTIATRAVRTLRETSLGSITLRT